MWYRPCGRLWTDFLFHCSLKHLKPCWRTCSPSYIIECLKLLTCYTDNIISNEKNVLNRSICITGLILLDPRVCILVIYIKLSVMNISIFPSLSEMHSNLISDIDMNISNARYTDSSHTHCIHRVNLQLPPVYSS